jgi:Trypsin
VRHIRAYAAIVGGAPISVAQAPWQVGMTARFTTVSKSFESILCSGAIIDASHILTAAHCAFIAPPNERIPPSDFTVYAGTSDLGTGEGEEQQVPVSGVRVHPYYTYNPDSGRVAPDDVAVLELAEPLTLGPTVSPIPLAPLGAYPAEGAAVNFTGFGEENPATRELSDKLNSIGMSIGASEQCGGPHGEFDAVIVCASAPSGSPCSGDSGSALTTLGSPSSLVGVMNDDAVVAGKDCTAGARSSFANVAAPEIQDFIDSSESPPLAPRGGGASCTALTPTAGSLMTCQAGTWSNQPTFIYTFIDSPSGRIAQSGGSSEYKFSAADVGSAVYVRVQATNPGGTGVSQTSPLAVVAPGPVEPKPSPPAARASLLTSSIVVSRSGVALVKLACRGNATCHGKLALTAEIEVGTKRKKTGRRVTIATVSFSISQNTTRSIRVKLNATGRTLLSTGSGHLSASLKILTLEPAPVRSQSKSVRLIEQKATGKRSSRVSGGSPSARWPGIANHSASEGHARRSPRSTCRCGSG